MARAARLAHPETLRMIKKFIDKLLGKTAARQQGRAGRSSPRGKRVEVPQSEHGIDPALVDERAAAASCTTLQEAGYEAYIVGGAVRDLLLGLRPEGLRRRHQRHAGAGQGRCSAAPSSSAGAFASCTWCSAAGREHEVIEVSTFRAYLDIGGRRAGRRQREDLAAANWPARRTSSTPSGRVLRDNVWGPQIEDAARRDFTINAMYYDPRDADRGRLPRRHQGREEEAAAHDRRPGHALPRRPGAHHPRGALRGQARLQDRAEDARADPAPWRRCSTTCRRRACSTR